MVVIFICILKCITLKFKSAQTYILQHCMAYFYEFCKAEFIVASIYLEGSSGKQIKWEFSNCRSAGSRKIQIHEHRNRMMFSILSIPW